MIFTNEMIYHSGSTIVVITVLAAVIAVVVFIFAGKRLKKRLEAMYGKNN